MHRPARSFTWGAAATAIAAGLILSGCSSSAPTDDAAEGDQTLRLALSAAPTDLSIGAGIQGDPTIYLAVYDTVVHLGPGGKLEPGIAESWEYSDDRLTLTLKIREGLEFTSGAALDAAAVAANIEAERTIPATAQTLASVSSVEATDESTVIITLSRPDASILPNLAASPGGIGDPALIGDESAKLAPVGSGPYILDTEASKTGSTYVLERNEDYWDVESFDFETVEIQMISDTTAVQNALLAGQLDYSGVTADMVSQFEGRDGFTVGDSQPSAYAALTFVDRAGKIVPALGEVGVRKAINLAINREEILEKLLFGKGYATNQMFNPVYGGFDEELLSETPYDLDEAKALMAEAGYADGFDLTLPSNALTTQYEPTLTQALADIGIRVTWETVQFTDLYSKIFGGSYGAFFFYAAANASPAQDANAATSGLFNPFNDTTPELEALLATANAAPEDEQDAAFRDVNEYFVENAWFAPLNAGTGNFVTTDGVVFDPSAGYGHLSAFSVAD